MPRPELPVMARRPLATAPMTMLMAPISDSAWMKVRLSFGKSRAAVWATSLAGVMG